MRVRFRNAAISFSDWSFYRFADDRGLGSRHPTRRTNFCGADWLLKSPRCCDMAPQIAGARDGCSGAVVAGLGGEGLLPTTMLSRSMTAILC